jgi:hypothetical protein
MGKKNKIKSFLKKKLKIKKFFLHKSVFKGFIRTMVFILNMMIINKLGEVTITETQLEGMSRVRIPSIEEIVPAMAGPAEGKITNFFWGGAGLQVVYYVFDFMYGIIDKEIYDEQRTQYLFLFKNKYSPEISNFILIWFLLIAKLLIRNNFLDVYLYIIWCLYNLASFLNLAVM